MNELSLILDEMAAAGNALAKAAAALKAHYSSTAGNPPEDRPAGHEEPALQRLPPDRMTTPRKKPIPMKKSGRYARQKQRQTTARTRGKYSTSSRNMQTGRRSAK